MFCDTGNGVFHDMWNGSVCSRMCEIVCYSMYEIVYSMTCLIVHYIL